VGSTRGEEIPTIVVFSGLPSTWQWYAKDCGDRARWIFYTELEPRTLLERYIRRPRLSRVFTAFRCVRSARRASAAAIASFSQFNTLWTALALRLLHVDKPLLAITFHFSKLPTGARFLLSKWAYSRVARFSVHSEVERERYARHFGIPVERFDFVRWGVEPSSVDIAERPAPLAGPYICALGKDGRDYRTLIEAMKRLPHLVLVLVVQPYNIAGIDLPENVKVYCDIPREDALNILKHSQFMALPLESNEISCGHITIVSAMFCRKAIVATRSSGIEDYFPPDYDAPMVPAGDVDGWVHALQEMTTDPERLKRCEVSGEEFGRRYCSHDAAFRSTMEVFRRAGIPIC
jgi:glycosyltransferase involved in cell wall biosynthesis